MGRFRLTRLTTTRTWGKPPPSPLWYTMYLSTRPTSKWHFVSRLPNRSPKIAKVGTPTTLGSHNFVCRPLIEMRSKAHRELSNDMSHASFMQGNWVDSQLLVVGSQNANLTPNPSFGHNLCFRCPNGSCERTLNIYVPITFQWYKELPNSMVFDPCSRSLKIQESIRILTPKMRAHLGMGVGVGVFILSHSPTLSTSREHEMWLMGFTFGPHPCKPLLWSRAQG
jgi:hypothetical protein